MIGVIKNLNGRIAAGTIEDVFKKVFEKLDPGLRKLVEDTSEFTFADGALPRKFKLLIAMALDASHGAVGGVGSLAQQAMQAGEELDLEAAQEAADKAQEASAEAKAAEQETTEILEEVVTTTEETTAETTVEETTEETTTEETTTTETTVEGIPRVGPPSR